MLDFEFSDFFEDWKQIVLLPEDWETILKGETFADFGKGYSYEGGEFEDYWTFAGGIDGELCVTYGDGGQGFIGTMKGGRSRKLRKTTSHKHPDQVMSSLGERR